MPTYIACYTCVFSTEQQEMSPTLLHLPRNQVLEAAEVEGASEVLQAVEREVKETEEAEDEHTRHPPVPDQHGQ